MQSIPGTREAGAEEHGKSAHSQIGNPPSASVQSPKRNAVSSAVLRTFCKHAVMLFKCGPQYILPSVTCRFVRLRVCHKSKRRVYQKAHQPTYSWHRFIFDRASETSLLTCRGALHTRG
eukprot:1483203-Pleurochrysis_carterae.AAC.1